MTSKAEIRRVLERVALEIVNHPKMKEWNYRAAATDVLERTLLPLLLAGQAMRNAYPTVTQFDVNAWDAALAAAAERLRATQGGAK